jgi:hypothetical protein
VDALEGRARLDPNRLPRGRTYARSGAAGALVLGAGEVTAPVQGSRATPYRVTVRVRTFDDAEWGRVLDAFAAQIGHTAALLDGELPPEVAADAAGVGLDLLPGPGEIQPRCSCPDWADPCKHAAAVCYLVADELDRDPFGLLLLRGRSRDEVLAALAARRAGPEPSGGDAGGLGPIERPRGDPGVAARAAWRADGAARPDPPLPPLPPERAGRPPLLPVDPPAGSDVDPAGLRALAEDAAARALELALGSGSSGLELSGEEDLARRAAALVGPDRPGSADAFGALAARVGVGPRDLLRRALAWQSGGPAGLAVLDGTWDPDREATAVGRRALGPGSAARHNRVTRGDRQLRLGLDGRWYPYRRAGGTWEPDGPPEAVELPDDEAGAGSLTG